MTIYVDGDACPVKAECERAATRHGAEMKIVCNGGLRPSANPLIEVVYVDEGLDVADRWISERAGKGDIVVTADIPLASDCVARGAAVLKPDGEALTERNIGNVLATRDLMTDLRSADPLRQGGGRPFSKADRARFSAALDQALRKAAG
ncbi:YaiI/YqxD family protein [Tropicimonas sp. IMCC34011]|uniref:YaiI/YqxD family protein n=1 Tax=Tropicimonas sp. IMCC34011 TaxID=2248759 RepID=UPI000E232997|nr:YaiI/YqxD family protein [Tropicimonas sp. IMCC34011]